MNNQDRPKNLFKDINKPNLNLPTQNTSQNRNTNIQASVIISPQLTNVSAANMPQHPRGKKSNRGITGSRFAENPIDRYFIDLLKKIRQNQSFLKLKAEMVNSNELMRWLREGLDEFRPNQGKTRQHEQQYKGKNFLGLKLEELGFGRATLMPGQHAKKIDIIFDKVIQTLTKQTVSSPWLITKLLRKYLREGKFYPSLYQAQISNEVYKPNPKVIDTFFVSAESDVINELSSQYSELLAKCIELYFQQYNACILCLQSFVQLQFEESFRMENRQSAEGLFTRSNVERSLGLVLWQNYCSLTDSILNQPEAANVIRQSTDLTKMAQKCREIIQQKKIRVLLYLAFLFQKAANQNERIQRELASSVKDFSETAILRIDSDIRKVEASGKIVSLHVSLLIRKLTELLLSIFPWKTVQEERNNSSYALIKRVMQKTVSNPLKPIRILMESQANKAEQAFGKINQQLQNGDWAIHSYQWKRWLGLFLRKFNNGIKMLARFPFVMKHIIWLCKTVMKEECEQFWQEEKIYKKRMVASSEYRPRQQIKQNRTYLIQLLHFLQKVIRDDNSTNRGVSINDCFCILTSSLGSHGKNHIKDTLIFILESNFQAVSLHIKQNIIASLNLQERSSDRNTRIVYSQAEKQKNIEHQLKFLCRIVQIGSQVQLSLLQQHLFQDSGQNSQTGFIVIVFLCKIFQRLSTESVHDIKCLRYIIRALDALFIDLDTRTFLPIALGVTQTGKWSCGKTIRQIVDLCTQTKGPSEMVRQAKKLRSTFGLHINNILKISNSIHEYFPSGSRRQDEKMYEKLQSWLKVNDFGRIKIDFLQRKNPPLKYVPWLHNFLLVLESNRLTAIDLQNVHQLLLKMRVQRSTTKEFTNMELIVEMMNNGNLQAQIAKILTPLVVSKQSTKKYLFGLANNKFQSFISITDTLEDVFKVQSSNQTKLYEYISNAHSKRITTRVQSQVNSPNKLSLKVKYSSKQYRLAKQSYRRQKEMTQIYEEISNSLRVIQTVLRLNFEGQFELLKRLNLAKWVHKSLLQKSHFYTVPFTVQLESQATQPETIPSKKKEIKLVQHELNTSINIIHTIASLLDFQQRFDINQSLHPSYRTKLKGNCYFELNIWHDHQVIDKKVVERIQLNLLGQQPTRNNISISILQILQHLIHLNYQKKAYYCLTNRIYPQNKASSNSSSSNKILEQFFVSIMGILIRPYSSMRMRQICLSFLCSCMKSNKFSEFIRSKAYNYKEPLINCLQFLFQEGGVAMITKMLLFLNLILSDRPQNEDLMFVKSCLQDIIGFGSNLGNLTQGKLRQIKAPPKSSSAYDNMLWSKRAQQIIFCKMSLLLYVALLSIFINTQNQYLVPGMVQWLLRQSQVCTKSITEISYQQLATLQLGYAKKIEQSMRKRSQKGYLEFTKQLHQWLLFEGQGSLGEDFVCRRWQTYHRALQKQDPGAIDNAVIALRINNQYSIQLAQSALTQLYFTVLLGLFQRGKNGYYFIEGKQTYSQKMTFAISPHGERSGNSLSGIQLIKDKPQNMRRIFTLVNNILNELWKEKASNQNMIGNKNNGILLLAQLIRMINRYYQTDQNSGVSLDTESLRVISKIEGHLWGAFRQTNENMCVSLLQSVLQLNYKSNSKGIINGSAQNIRKYLSIITNNYEQVIQKMEVASILKVGILIEQLEINTLLQIQNNRKTLRYYLGCDQHKILIGLIKNCLEIAVKVIEDKSTNDGILSFGIVAFTKCMQISYLIKDFYMEPISKEFSHRLATRLQLIAQDRGDQQALSALFLLSFLTEASASSSTEWTRMIVRILNDKMIAKVGTCGSVQSLWNLIENKLILQTLINMSGVECWYNKQTGSVLTEVFVTLQRQIHKFLVSRVTPINQIEHELASRIVLNSQRYAQINNASGSIYNIVVLLRMHQNIKYFLLFLFSSLQNCPLLAEFCEKSISMGPLEEHTWQRIKLSLQHISQFIVKFMQTSLEYKKEIVDLSVAISSEASLGSIALRAFFDQISSQAELFEDCFQTVMIFVECVNVFVRVWRTYDWKSRLDWRQSRKLFVVKCLSTVSKWKEMAKKMDRQNKMKQKLQRLILVLNECQAIE